jgi:glucosamine-6-phosphate deaminase
VLGVATGSSPLGVYAALAARPREVRWQEVRAFALDEYVGLPTGHDQSYAATVRREVTEPLGLDPRLVRVPDGIATDSGAAGEEYERAIVDAGGVDVQILGIGSNGHIGFNEPGSSLASRTRVVALTEATRAANARFFASPDDVPRSAMTQGVATIMNARSIVLVAQGRRKAEAIRQTAEGAMTSRWPGSVLQTHPDVLLVIDQAAASLLELTDHYRAEAELHGLV